jgi:hypothetical protein
VVREALDGWRPRDLLDEAAPFGTTPGHR